MTIQRTIDRQQILRSVERARKSRSNPGIEKEHGVGDWLDQVRASARTAWSAAKSGSMGEELDAWVEIAAIAVGRAEFIVAMLREEEESPS